MMFLLHGTEERPHIHLAVGNHCWWSSVMICVFIIGWLHKVEKLIIKATDSHSVSKNRKIRLWSIRSIRYCELWYLLYVPDIWTSLFQVWSFLDISRISTKPNSTFFYNLQDELCSHMIRYVGRATVERFSSIWCLKSSISWWKRWFWPASNIFDPKVFSDFDCDKKK